MSTPLVSVSGMIVTQGDYGPRTDVRRRKGQVPRQPTARSIHRMTVAESIRPHSVRFTSDSDRIDASQRTDAMCQSRPNAPQQKSNAIPSRR
jgi:hypothetical protein